MKMESKIRTLKTLMEYEKVKSEKKCKEEKIYTLSFAAVTPISKVELSSLF